MAWQTIAKKDARAVLDSQLFRYFLGFVAFAFVVGGYLLPNVVETPATSDFPGYMSEAVTLLVPLLGLLLGYKAIVGERASGRLGLLLSLPHSRRDVVLGKFVGRGGLLALAISAGIVTGSWLVYYPYGSFDPLDFLAYLVVTLCFGLAFVGIAFAISTLTTSEHVATAATFGTFFVMVVVWPELRPLLALALEQIGLANGGLPDWALLLHGLTPGMSYERALTGLFTADPAGAYFGPDAAWYLGTAPALGLLFAWTVLPITIGYLRFQSTDL